MEGWESMSIESTPPLSPLSYIDDRSVSPAEFALGDDADPAEIVNEPSTLSPSRLLFDHRQDIETLQAKQYWRKDWHTDAPLSKPFHLADPSSLG